MTYHSTQNEYCYSDDDEETNVQYNTRKDKDFEEECSNADKTLEQMHDILKNKGLTHLLDGVSSTTLMRMTKQNKNIFQTEEDLDKYLEADKYDTEEILYQTETDKWSCDTINGPEPMTLEDCQAVLEGMKPNKPVKSTGPVYGRNCFGKMRRKQFMKIKNAHEFKDRMLRIRVVQDSCKRKMTLQLKEMEEKREQMRQVKAKEEMEANKKAKVSKVKKNTKKASFLAFLLNGKKKSEEPLKVVEEVKVTPKVTEKNFNYTKTVKQKEETMMTTSKLLSQYIGTPAPKYVKGQSEKVTLKLFTHMNKQ